MIRKRDKANRCFLRTHFPNFPYQTTPYPLSRASPMAPPNATKKTNGPAPEAAAAAEKMAPVQKDTAVRRKKTTAKKERKIRNAMNTPFGKFNQQAATRSIMRKVVAEEKSRFGTKPKDSVANLRLMVSGYKAGQARSERALYDLMLDIDNMAEHTKGRRGAAAVGEDLVCMVYKQVRGSRH